MNLSEELEFRHAVLVNIVHKKPTKQAALSSTVVTLYIADGKLYFKEIIF